MERKIQVVKRLLENNLGGVQRVSNFYRVIARRYVPGKGWVTYWRKIRRPTHVN